MAQNNPHALYFDGLNDYAGPISCPDYAYCVEIWFNTVYNIIPSTVGDLIGFNGAGGIRLGNVDSNLANETFVIYGGGGATYTTGTISAGTHHLAVSWNGTSYNVYFDGIQKTTNYYYGKHAGLMAINNAYIGRLGPNYPQTTFFFQGSLDEIRLWSVSRSAQQINDNMTKKLIGNEPGLMAYYRFDEGTGTTISDSGPNKLNSTITGATWVNGLVNLTESGAVLASATGYGRATGIAKPSRGRVVGATAHGQASATASPIRGRGLRATAFGTTTATARPHKIAIARAAAQGAATARATALVLFIPKGVYGIDADNIFNRNQPITPDSLANYIEVWINPLKPVSEAEEVYKTDEDDPFPVKAGETKTVTIHYKKEPVTGVSIEFVNSPPYATIDSIKYYAWGADVTVTSPDAGTFGIVATGKPLEVQGRELVVRKDETSILENGIKKYTFDNPFIQDRATAEMIGDKLLAFAIPQADIEIDWRGDPALMLADVTMIPEFQRQGLDQRGVFYVTKQELEYDGGLRAKLAGRKMGGNE